jgi:hypothetical protein
MTAQYLRAPIESLHQKWRISFCMKQARAESSPQHVGATAVTELRLLGCLPTKPGGKAVLEGMHL